MLLISSGFVWGYYSFTDVKSECLGGSFVSSPYSNPALMCEEGFPSFYGEFSSLFFDLPSPSGNVAGYYKPDVSRKMVSFLNPGSSYSTGFSYRTVASPIHSEALFSVSVARNLNDFLVSRFEDRINFSATANIYTLRFVEFPSDEYSGNATAFSFDFSLFARFSDNMSYGIGLKNAGSPDIGISRQDKMPEEFVFSISNTFRRLNLIFTFENSYIGSELSAAASLDFSSARVLFSADASRAAAGVEFMSTERLKVTAGGSFLFASGSFQPKIGVNYFFRPAKPRKSKTQMMKEFYNLAYQNYRNRNYMRAIFYWKEVLKIDPNHRLSKINVEKAKKAYKRFYFNLATKEYKLGNYGKAIKYWRKVLELDPNHELSRKKMEKAKAKLKERGDE
ncbi:MAG: tetratricopeptide repeat protein [Elusimicrobia bacterium]|nr:tetratricopeptide repeat protein [Elusimicrobiota bacterium]